MNKYKIVTMAQCHWAGSGYYLHEALNSHSDRIEARCIQVQEHPFGFPADIVATDKNADETRRVIDEADGIVYTCTNYIRELPGGIRIPKEKVIAQWHAGSEYRNKTQYYDDLDARMGIKLRFMANGPPKGGYKEGDHELYVPIDLKLMGDFMVVGVKAKQIVFPDRFVIGHFPSSPEVKGTQAIVNALDRDRLEKEIGRKVEFLCSSGVPHKLSLLMKSMCDVYIDHTNVVGEGLNVATFEAVGMGVPVLADYTNISEGAAKAFPPTAPQDLTETIIRLAKKDDLSEGQYEYVRDNIGYEATAKRITPLLVQAIEGLK